MLWWWIQISCYNVYLNRIVVDNFTAKQSIIKSHHNIFRYQKLNIIPVHTHSPPISWAHANPANLTATPHKPYTPQDDRHAAKGAGTPRYSMLYNSYIEHPPLLHPAHTHTHTHTRLPRPVGRRARRLFNWMCASEHDLWLTNIFFIASNDVSQNRYGAKCL